MSEEEIRQYLSRQTSAPEVPTVRPRMAVRRPKKEQETFKDFSASHLMCPTCRRAMPVREKVLLFLPDGDLYDYSCTACGSSCGRRKVGK
jgi:hypothetical protein